MAFSIQFQDCSLEYQEEVEAFIAIWKTDCESIIAKSSGSTGTPKSISLTRKMLVASAKRSNRFFCLGEKSHVLATLSLATIGGKMIIIRAIVGEYSVTVVPPSKQPFTSVSENTLFDFVSFVPLQVAQILKEKPLFFNQFRQILLGGSPLSAALETALQHFDARFYMGFGMTETVSHIAIRPLGTRFYTCLNGVTVSENNSALIIHDRLLDLNHFQVNDAVAIVSETEFEWLGRTDFVVNSGGIKLHPEAIEQCISDLVTGDFLIVGLPDTDLGEKCVLISEVIVSAEIRIAISDRIREHFSKYAVPKDYMLHSIARMENMKVNRRATLQQLLLNNDAR